VLIAQPPNIVEAMQLEIRFQLRQPNLHRPTLPRRVIFDILLKRSVQRANLAESRDHKFTAEVAEGRRENRPQMNADEREELRRPLISIE
jgi:hypothetical protein